MNIHFPHIFEKAANIVFLPFSTAALKAENNYFLKNTSRIPRNMCVNNRTNRKKTYTGTSHNNKDHKNTVCRAFSSFCTHTFSTLKMSLTLGIGPNGVSFAGNDGSPTKLLGSPGLFGVDCPDLAAAHPKIPPIAGFNNCSAAHLASSII